jgi:hypothetical protein
MKPRARRVTMGVAALVAIIAAVLVVANWSTVRDHVEAWHFQLTRETETIEPRLLAPPPREGGGHEIEINDPEFNARPKAGLAQHFDSVVNKHGIQAPSVARYLLEKLARCSCLSVIFDPTQTDDPSVSRGEAMVARSWPEGPQPALRRHGFRVLEQRFPRRAYVVIRAAAAPEASSPVMWDGVDLPVPTE